MNHAKAPLLLASLLAGLAFAGPTTFKVGTGFATQQSAQFESVTSLETFTGTTNQVTGLIVFDAAKKTGSGSLSIDAGSFDTKLALRTQHLKGPNYLDAAKYPHIEFKAAAVKHLNGDNYEVTGPLTIHGVTKTVTTRVALKFLKQSASTKKAGFKGDVVQVKTSFKVALADYAITMPAIAKGKLAETVTVSVTAYGQTGA